MDELLRDMEFALATTDRALMELAEEDGWNMTQAEAARLRALENASDELRLKFRLLLVGT